MLSSVLNSGRAILVNIEIMRAFVRLREMLASHAALARKLVDLEKRYDAQFKVVFDAIRELMSPPRPSSKPIGFAPWNSPGGQDFAIAFFGSMNGIGTTTAPRSPSGAWTSKRVPAAEYSSGSIA